MSIEPSILRNLALPMFNALGEDDLRAIAARLGSVNFAAGEHVFSRGDPGTMLYIIMSGRLRLSVSTDNGRELAFRVAGPGETVGEMAALDGGVRSADAVTMEPARALVLMRTDLDRLLDERPALARGIIAWLCKRLRETSDQLENVALLDVEQRLARFLLALARNQTQGEDGRARVAIDMSQAEIGFLLGASRPKVNIALAAFEQAGLVERKGQGFLCDLRALATRAGGDLA